MMEHLQTYLELIIFLYTIYENKKNRDIEK